jgi:hypothetical protein
MKVIINENQKSVIEVQKNMLFRLWDKQGYANYDMNKIKLFGLFFHQYTIIQHWVLEWNKKNGVDPLKYLKADFTLFEVRPGLYLTDETDRGRKIRFERNEISFLVTLWGIEVNVPRQYIRMSMEIDLDSITENGRSIYEDIPPAPEDNDDEFYEVAEEYREKCVSIIINEFQEKYSHKMGYDLEIDV